MLTGIEVYELLCECGAANVSLAERDNFEHFAHGNGIPITSYYVITGSNGYAKIALRRGVGRGMKSRRESSLPRIAGVLI